ncbi:hypothetical protein BBO99_00009748 [Phytophthora kernoviae]|uniref:FYVE-type domain-containing protein n=2 Tax=Phytophthora kernoviae TaxID=325452 RepID=A0A421FAY6_9STRA|nr:hypothetical protein G195_011350 [Phytophthora kernoviae 00238/432]KAG2502916.1 hypothetical protein JM18_009720 [Phytophthora kernoviae]RLN36559.1 hypothetical protein BBI17_009640 [Phytophthora kernoviae]RLN72680.1 hypothetical protein BBO99_00009748 [Phytophthora kernoviae]
MGRSIRLHLGKESESAPSYWNDGEPPAPPLQLSIALHDLMAEAEALHDRVDFAGFVDLVESPRIPIPCDGQQQWKRAERSATFSLLKRNDEVLAFALLDATAEEVASILCSTAEKTYCASMNGLYQDTFISGSIPYVQRSHNNQEDGMHQQLAVKTSNFVRPDVLSKNEQWCFAELFRRKSQGDSFTLVQGSLSAEQARLRIVFHAIYKPDSLNGGDSEGEKNTPIVPRKAVMSRMLRLAQGIAQFSQLVRRRRFGAQVFADRSAFDMKNPRCTCCTRRLTLFVNVLPRTRCYLCGYHVCVTCSTSEQMETHNGRLASIMVCIRCRNSVFACDYQHMLSVLPGPVRVLDDRCCLSGTMSTASDTSTASTTSTTSSSSQMLADLLGGIVDDSTGDITTGRRNAALTVLEQLLTADQEKTQAQADVNANLLSTAINYPQQADAIKRALDISNCPADPAACEVASAESRSYPMMPALVDLKSDSHEPAEPIIYPIPANEEIRLAAIEHFKLHDVVNIPELNVICTLAAAEMNCPHSVVTLVEREVVTLMATNAPENWDVGSGNPREQTFCQHFVMDDRPLLVSHAEADMRFYHIAPVVMRSLRFYAGFPISVTSVRKTKNPGEPEKVIVGSLCCLDAKPHQMTRSQYWRLMKLAEAASAILEKQAEEFLVNPNKFASNLAGTGTSKGTTAVAC